MAASLRQFFGRLLALAARLVGAAQGQSGIALLPYRGYGSKREIFLIGRVFKRSNEALADRWKGMPGQLRNVLRRITSGAVAGAEITASFSGSVQRVKKRYNGKGGGAIVGFTNLLLTLHRVEQPRAVIVGWDTLEAPTYRQKAFIQPTRVAAASMKSFWSSWR